jgi:hypothetical protein
MIMLIFILFIVLFIFLALLDLVIWAIILALAAFLVFVFSVATGISLADIPGLLIIIGGVYFLAKKFFKFIGEKEFSKYQIAKISEIVVLATIAFLVFVLIVDLMKLK